MANEEVILLEFPISMFAMRVKIALAEKGIEYESQIEDLNNKSPLLLRMNPVHKKIPVLIHNGKPISESTIILHYIDEVWNDKYPLLPSHPYKRAQARFWADYIDKKVFETGKKLILAKGEDLEVAKKDLLESLKLLEEEIGEGGYFGGENFGFVDMVVMSYYAWFGAFEKTANFSLERECPKLESWAKMCMERESVSKSIVDSETVLSHLAMIKQRLGLN